MLTFFSVLTFQVFTKWHEPGFPRSQQKLACKQTKHKNKKVSFKNFDVVHKISINILACLFSGQSSQHRLMSSESVAGQSEGMVGRIFSMQTLNAT